MRAILILTGAVAVLSTSPAFAQAVTVSERECRQLVEHIASQDVNFKPGVDVYGRPVAPANTMTSPIITAPQNFTFDVGVDLKRFGIPNNSPIFQPSVGVGKITVEDGGRRVLYNGQPLGNSEQNALAEACKQRAAAPRK
jgi:hypothetical protein